MPNLIRDARPADLDPINDIYNHYVLHSTATFHERPLTADERLAWWREHAERYPVLVLGEGERLLGWACLSPYVGRCGYRFTVEDSVYLRPEACGRGLGRVLLSALLERGRAAGFHSVVAFVVADQPPSLRLHERLGFQRSGRLAEVGHKFGRWLDVVLMQKLL
ncbi:MAG TPA: GNAT family N-acetyltransferase [Phycisphaerae bacterium]|nr:GNAT family N-acetyltransferase [Phycisphaerae bacterium]